MPSGSVRLSTSWSNVGSRLTLVTVHVNVSVASAVGGLSLTVMLTAYGLPAAAVKAMVPVISPVLVSMRQARRQVGGGIGQGVAVGVGATGVEVDDRVLGIGPVAQVLVERRVAVDVADRPVEGVGGVDRGAVAHGDRHGIRAARGGGERDGAGDEPGASC